MVGILQDKVALVTGGGTGIGRATSLILAKEGATVVIADLQDDESRTTVDMIDAEGGRAEYRKVDVSNYAQVDGLINDIVGKHGSLDCAFNNAGVEGTASKVHDCTMENWDRVIAVNLTGVFICMKLEIRQMLEQKAGSIVNTASVGGLVAVVGTNAYGAAKHGVLGLTKTAAVEYGADGIRVNAVCPGFIDTPMLDRISRKKQEFRDMVVERVPVKRVARPSEIGDAVAWLLSEHASYVTGVALPVDGGWVAL